MMNILPFYVWTTALLWIIISLIIAFLGDQRQIGFVRAFIASILLTPLLGMFITLSTERKDVARWRRRLTRRSIDSKKFIHTNEDFSHVRLHDELEKTAETLIQRTDQLQRHIEELHHLIRNLQKSCSDDKAAKENTADSDIPS